MFLDFVADIHPLLFGETRWSVRHWTPIGNPDGIDRSVVASRVSWFHGFASGRPRRNMLARDFSAFLRQDGELAKFGSSSGQDRRNPKQFHPHPSMHLIATGRAAGPMAPSATPQAVSDSYLDVACRIHAEFFGPRAKERPARSPINAWYSPAYFEGNMLVNQKKTGTVIFSVGVGEPEGLNRHLRPEPSAHWLRSS